MGLVAPWHVGSSWTRARTMVPCIGRQDSQPPRHWGNPGYAFLNIDSTWQGLCIFTKYEEKQSFGLYHKELLMSSVHIPFTKKYKTRVCKCISFSSCNFWENQCSMGLRIQPRMRAVPPSSVALVKQVSYTSEPSLSVACDYQCPSHGILYELKSLDHTVSTQ